MTVSALFYPSPSKQGMYGMFAHVSTHRIEFLYATEFRVLFSPAPAEWTFFVLASVTTSEHCTHQSTAEQLWPNCKYIKFWIKYVRGSCIGSVNPRWTRQQQKKSFKLTPCVTAADVIGIPISTPTSIFSALACFHHFWSALHYLYAKKEKCERKLWEWTVKCIPEILSSLLERGSFTTHKNQHRMRNGFLISIC